MPASDEIGSGQATRHAPIAGDDYTPPQSTRLVLRDGRYVAEPAQAALQWDAEAREREIARIREYDKPVKPSPIQITIPGAGGALERPAKLLFKAMVSVVSKVVRKIVEVRNRKEARRQADREAVRERERSLRDAIDSHFERMREQRERNREQDAIDREEHRKRIGDPTQVA